MRTTLLFLCVLMVSSAAFAQWTRTNGPEGVAISSLANIDGTIYAGTEVNGLYASTDDGIKWAPLNAGIETQEVTSVASQAGYLFAGTFGSGVYRSTDGGQTWMPPLSGGNLAVTAMVVNDPYIFAGSIEEGVYRSSDNGETWAEKLSAFGMGPMCISGNTIFASTSNYTFGSTDNGETWFNVSALEGAAIFSFYCKDSLIMAGGRNKIYKSTNYGSSFTTIDLNFPFSIVNIYAVTSIGSTFFAATSYDGVYKSTDDGLSWSPTNEGMGPKDARALTISNSSTLIAGTHYVGMYRSTDLGLSWNKSVAGFPAGSSILSLLVNGSSVFAGTRDGVYRTEDNGNNWVKLAGANDTTKYCDVWAMCELDGVIYASMQLYFDTAIYKSTDNGANWIRCGGAGLPPNLSFIKGLVASGDNIVAGTDEGIYYSSNGGDNWFPTNVLNLNIPSMAASGNFVYAAVPSGFGVYRSADNGVSWTVALQSTVDYVEVAAIDNYAFAGSFFEGTRYSTNFGSTWFASSGFPTGASVFALGPVGDGMILAGTDLGPSWVYASFNNGASFSPYSEGLGQRAPVEAFAVNDSFMFAGTDYNGVWRRLRPGIVGIPTQPDVAQEFMLFDNYPNPFNPSTTIRYALPGQANVTLRIYNILGQEIRTLVNERQSAGVRSVVWDGRNNLNQAVSSGIYIYRLQAGARVLSKKMILLE
jgi:photosystem II stability/assembly factor-like uncharacterized protein